MLSTLFSNVCSSLLLALSLAGCGGDGNTPPEQGEYSVATHDATVQAPFGPLDYRVYYPDGLTGTTHLIHVSRGGNGLGDDRVALPAYVDALVRDGYVVLSVDHRFAGNDVERIAELRGEEIQFMASEVTRGGLDYGGFTGGVEALNQGFLGHSGGCMEGLMAAGTDMTHGNYTAPNIRALYGISPAGFDPDQFGIAQAPVGYSQIGAAWIFVVVGEQEKDRNGLGAFKAQDWRLQAFDAMNTAAPRFEAFVQGDATGHGDVNADNPDIAAYNTANALALFDTVLRGADLRDSVGRLALPPENPVRLRSKGP